MHTHEQHVNTEYIVRNSIWT